MKTRQYIILGIIGLTVIATVIINKQFEKAGQKKKDEPASEYKIEAKVIEVKNQSYPAEINFTGRVRAIDRIDMYAEVSGVLLKTSTNFKEGNYFKKGATLIRIDDREMRLSLVSKKSQFINSITKIIPDLRVDYSNESLEWEQYLNSLDPHKTLPPLPEITNKKLNYFISGRNIKDAYFDIKSSETKLSKYTIRAPFNGIVSKSNITTGTLVRSGQSLGEFISKNNYELEAAISFKDLKFITIGDKVKLFSKDLNKELMGQIYRISDVINEETQTINIYMKVKSEGFIKEGMYLQGSVKGSNITDAFAIPRLLLQPNDLVFTVDSAQRLKHQEVDVIKINQDAVILKGLSNGTKIINKPLARAIEGTKVEIIKD